MACDLIDTVVARVSAMPGRELLAEALDALTPFAVAARSIDVDPPGDHEPSHGRGSVTAGDLRRARAAADKIRDALTQEKQRPIARSRPQLQRLNPPSAAT